MKITSAIAIGLGTTIGVTCALLIPYALVISSSRSSIGELGQLGDYVGGVLGTAFTAFAFIGVVITLALQRTQLLELQTQAQGAKLESSRAELQKVTVSVVDYIEKLLDSPLMGGRHLSLREAVSYRCHVAINNISSDQIDSDNKRWIFESPGLDELESRVDRIRFELEQIKWCVEQYLLQGGSTVVANFYKRRFMTLHKELVEAHYFESSSELSEFFASDS